MNTSGRSLLPFLLLLGSSARHFVDQAIDFLRFTLFFQLLLSVGQLNGLVEEFKFQVFDHAVGLQRIHEHLEFSVVEDVVYGLLQKNPNLLIIVVLAFLSQHLNIVLYDGTELQSETVFYGENSLVKLHSLSLRQQTALGLLP